jgi:hypothetical protein
VEAAALLLFGVLASAAPAATAQTNLPAEEFTLFAVNMGMYTSGSTANLIIRIDRWSSQAEHEQLFATLREKGPQALLEALQDARRVGSIRTPQSVGYDLRLALQEVRKDGSRRLLIATDRPMDFLEARNRPRSVDYPFTVIEMILPAEGKGQGTMTLAARIVSAGKTLIVENYDTQPIRLTNIEARKLDRR